MKYKGITSRCEGIIESERARIYKVEGTMPQVTYDTTNKFVIFNSGSYGIVHLDSWVLVGKEAYRYMEHIRHPNAQTKLIGKEVPLELDECQRSIWEMVLSTIMAIKSSEKKHITTMTILQ